MIIVSGNTYKFSTTLKNLGFKWDKMKKQWTHVLSDRSSAKLEVQLLYIREHRDILIEIMDIDPDGKPIRRGRNEY
jgi:hypothetical protein